MTNKSEILRDYLVAIIDEIMQGFTDDTKKDIENNNSLTEREQKDRKELIDIKVNHSKRVAKDIQDIFSDKRFDNSWGVLGYFLGQVHDIGRFLEGEHANTFNPSDVNKYYNEDFSDTEYDWVKEHASLGVALLVNKQALHEIWKAFKLNEQQMEVLDKVIGDVVRNHQKDQKVSEDLNMDLDRDAALLQSNVFDLLINNKLSEHDISKIISFYSDLVRDIDKVDILYQHLTGEFPVLRETTGYLTQDDNIEAIANYWGISVEELLSVNDGVNQNLEKNDKRVDKVQIPVQNLKPEKLFVPKDVEEMFYTNTIAPKLRELQERRDWTPLTGMLWRLSTFLGQARFTGTLRSIKETNLLDKILATYPSEYQDYMRTYFEASKTTFLNDSINSGLYVNHEQEISKTK